MLLFIQAFLLGNIWSGRGNAFLNQRYKWQWIMSETPDRNTRQTHCTNICNRLPLNKERWGTFYVQVTITVDYVTDLKQKYLAQVLFYLEINIEINYVRNAETQRKNQRLTVEIIQKHAFHNVSLCSRPHLKIETQIRIITETCWADFLQIGLRRLRKVYIFKWKWKGYDPHCMNIIWIHFYILIKLIKTLISCNFWGERT